MIDDNLNQLTAHSYWLPPDAATDRPILGAITGQNSTLIVDAGNSPAHARLFLGELAKINIAPPRFLVLTHWHWDHVFGASAMDLPILASVETRHKVLEMAGLDWSDQALDRRVEEGLEIEFCRDMIKTELPDRRGLTIRPPDIAFCSPLELDLGGITCDIVPVGGDHASDSTIVYLREDQVMFLGDCLCKNIYTAGPGYTSGKLFPLIDQLLSYPADFYLEAHTPEPISRQQMVEDTTLLKHSSI